MSLRAAVLRIIVLLLAVIGVFAFGAYLLAKVSVLLGALVFVLLFRALSQLDSDEYSYLTRAQRVPYLLLLPTLATAILFATYAASHRWWVASLVGLVGGGVLTAFLMPRLLPRLATHRRATKLLSEGERESDVGESLGRYARALHIAREAADHKLEARAIAGMGEVRRKQGRAREALALFRDAIRVMSSGDVPLERTKYDFTRSVLTTTGELLIAEGDRYMRLGRSWDAREYYAEARSLLSRVIETGPILYPGVIGADPDPRATESSQMLAQIDDWQDRLVTANGDVEGVPTAAGTRVTGPSYQDGVTRREGGVGALGPLDRVDCTVFAPPAARQGDAFLVQAFTHVPEEAMVAQALASEFSETAQRRGYKSLGTEIPRGTTLTFDLSMPGLEVDEPVQSLIWSGRPESVQFGVTVPSGREPGTLIGTVTASIDSVPVGHIKFEFTVTEAKSRPASVEPEPAGDDARGYALAFCSYASEDRNEVLRRVQMLTALGIRYFQDIMDLDPGDRWEQKLYQHIDESDLFLLFWSTSAKESEWVRKEAGYALARKSGDPFAPPEIRPIIIEGPPVVPPWKELSDLHFNDRLIYVLHRD